jgi:hypothetical protein
MQRLAALMGGFREDGAIGAQEEPAGFRPKLRARRVLRHMMRVVGPAWGGGPEKTERNQAAPV